MSAPFRLFDTVALRSVEAHAAGMLGDGFELMRRAGQAAWRETLACWPRARRIVVVCGPGNNGGDGYVLARHAVLAGLDTQVVHLPGHEPHSALARRACTEYGDAGGRIVPFAGDLPECDLMVDAVFGIGLSRAPDGPVVDLIAAIDRHPGPILALDCPSGVDSDRGAVAGIAVHATRTLEFIAPKAGLRTGAALECVGKSSLAPLDLEPSFFADAAASAELLGSRDLPRWLRPRARNAHKGLHGRVLCLGGEHGGGGAILLCAEAALRCGAGLVHVGTRALHVAALLSRVPETLAHALEEAPDVAPLLPDSDVVAIGPGLGQREWGHALYQRALHAGRPLVLDADALNLLAATPSRLPADAVITPHPGEAARLLGVATADVQRDRYEAARELVSRYGCTVVLKGAGTVVAAPAQLPRVVGAGNPGMAVGGMGDVLTGTIAALRAQGLDAFDAASAGALLHALAGDAAADNGERGLLPSDLMPWLRRLANPEPVQ